ncbi:MAG: F0F1 ATP synthase subunit delta [gamma proteobacterium endosymbiont of Trioza apicalis]
MLKYINIAKPYAKAIFKFANKNKNINNWQYMLTFIAELSRNPIIYKFLLKKNSFIKESEKFIKICDKKIDIYCKNLIKIMSLNKRLLILPYVLEQFILYKIINYQNLFKIKIITAFELNNNQKIKIKNLIEKKLNLKVLINYKIEKFIIGGISIFIGDMVISNNIIDRMKQIKNKL